MENVIYVSVINPCFSCGCPAYDPDLGCMIPSNDLWYACPLEPDPKYPDDFIKIQENKENDNE